MDSFPLNPLNQQGYLSPLWRMFKNNWRHEYKEEQNILFLIQCLAEYSRISDDQARGLQARIMEVAVSGSKNIDRSSEASSKAKITRQSTTEIASTVQDVQTSTTKGQETMQRAVEEVKTDGHLIDELGASL